MRIGIMGGTLDPVHRGHVDIALQVMSAMQLDRVMLLPAGDPPHKSRTTAKVDRLRMAEIAAEEHEGLFVCDAEINRKGTTYTVDTLMELSRRQPDVTWIYIVGADTLNVLDSWREFPKVAKLCSFAAVRRPGSDEELCRVRAQELWEKYGARIALLDLDGPGISSTEIRRHVSAGMDILPLVPGGVADYIREKGLYLCDFTEEQLLEKLRKAISPRRFEHTLGVAETAERLAERFGVERHRARLAALLHDCAKSMDHSEMRKLVAKHVSDADKSEMESKSVLHAPAGMVVARKEYGVRDPLILNAIRRHTIGGPVMTAMDALIYVADFIEPGRADFPGLSRAREAAETDIFKALCICAELTSEYVKERGQKLHPRTMELLKNY